MLLENSTESCWDVGQLSLFSWSSVSSTVKWVLLWFPKVANTRKAKAGGVKLIFIGWFTVGVFFLSLPFEEFLSFTFFFFFWPSLVLSLFCFLSYTSLPHTGPGRPTDLAALAGCGSEVRLLGGCRVTALSPRLACCPHTVGGGTGARAHLLLPFLRSLAAYISRRWG